MVTAAAATPVSYIITSSTASNSPSSSRSHNHTSSLKLLPISSPLSSSLEPQLPFISNGSVTNSSSTKLLSVSTRNGNANQDTDAREIEVGSFLPPFPSDPSFVVFKASSKDTPALRAEFEYYRKSGILPEYYGN
ncbi:hypothetical protein C5167_003899 [Papaver somniferum]|uniref:Uncharacterized protein n=1 Tax=Papaver somniferum TaxID=3469 RepID=A0A4Y7L482_PAPSO|nr:hypothetical protein C5167_003899 [Papaver somniferum]